MVSTHLCQLRSHPRKRCGDQDIVLIFDLPAIGADRQVQLKLTPLLQRQGVSGRKRTEFDEVVIAMICRKWPDVLLRGVVHCSVHLERNFLATADLRSFSSPR